MPTKVLVFDLDGTLVDSMPRFADAAAALMAQYFQMNLTDARKRYLETSGLAFPHQLEKIFPQDKRNASCALDFQNAKLKIYSSCPFFSEVETCLSRFQAQDIKLAVSSNNDEISVRDKVSALKVKFDLVLGFRPGFQKGLPHFEKIQSQFSVIPNEILFVGDSLHDALLAQEAGVPFVGRTGTFHLNDFQKQGIAKSTLQSLEELAALISR